MTQYPKIPVVLPADLQCARNGYVAAGNLVPIGHATVLHHTAARAWACLWYAAKVAHLDLTFTYGGGYRAYWQQAALFMQRWDNTPRLRTPTEFYAGQQWWLKPGLARAGVPGTSNHGWGLALDLASGESPATARPINSAALSWLRDGAETFGWSWELDSEPWHIRFWAGDEVPAIIIEIEAAIVAAGGT